MRRVLMVSPHFPPDTSAATHRVRLLAPHLSRYGWEPTVVAVDPRDYEGRLDPELAQLVPHSLRVVRCRAWPARWTRLFGVGDLGLRALCGLYRTSARLLREERFDALFITLYPTYPALLGPVLKRRFGVPFVLDYQDPWVGAWGLTVGPGPDGRPTFKARATRALATRLEPLAVRAADAITAVSQRTYEAVLARNPQVRGIPCAEIPLGGEAADFDYLCAHPRPNRYFDPNDGNVHLCYVGTLLPLGLDVLRAVFEATILLRARKPGLYERLRIHFFGTSNQRHAGAPARVLPIATEFGITEVVTETAPRIDYLDALGVLTQASAILMLGSSEAHYTASKVYPGLAAKRPILALYHEASSVAAILRRVARAPTVRLVTYNDDCVNVESVYQELAALVERPVYDPTVVDLRAMESVSAASLAQKLAALLAHVSARRPCPQAPTGAVNLGDGAHPHK